MDTGHWILEENVNIEQNSFGFIYCIENNINKKKYLGKKQLNFKLRRKPLKGKKRVRIDFKESDWKSYTGSSNDLNYDITKYGIENFTFKILKICNSKWELSYYECKFQIDFNVLLRDDYYNGTIQLRIGRPPKGLKIVDN